METVQVLTDREHVLLRTETYLGSTEIEAVTDYVVKDDGTFVEETVNISQACAKICDEILVNASDHRVRHLENPGALKQRCTTIKVDFNVDEGWIRVWNNGDGLEVRTHSEVTDIYVPQLIFGQLRTGTNFNDDETRFRSGRNGLGAKCCNIFSRKFEVHTLDAERRLVYKQTWTDNMSRVTAPSITKVRSENPNGYTCVQFWPDFPRLGVEKLTPEIVGLLRKRVYDIAATGPPGSKTFLDGKKLAIDNLQKYMKLHLSGGEKVMYEEPNARWKVGLAFTPGSGRAVSFVNGLATTRGGTHVDHVMEPIVKAVQVALKKKLPEQRVTSMLVKEHLTVFITCLVENPAFESQRKEELKTPARDFGSTCKVSAAFLDKVVAPGLGLVKHICDVLTGKAQVEMMKATDGKKSARVRGIPKLEDAFHAGSPKSHKCILILSEGDSARTMVISGLASLTAEERKYIGIFPLRGKLLNVRDAPAAKLEGNAEFAHVKRILGLQQGRVYEDVKSLRYGRVMIMTDADQDGSHIAGLIINMMHAMWPSLIERMFLCRLATPVVKAFPKKGGGEPIEFYSAAQFDEWRAAADVEQYRVKYYKGLGTSMKQEAMGYFRDYVTKLITYHDKDGGAAESVPLAFDKSRANDRKEWLMTYDPTDVIDASTKEVSISEFIHRDLKHFSAADVRRSIPALTDGLVASRRKILWTCFQRKLTDASKEVRVSQLAGAVSELSLYHHGEASLCQTIVRMAQTFVGMGLPLLEPVGQFGTRLQGGADSASPRYIFTHLGDVAPYIFRKEDEGILEYVEEDGVSVEPKEYLPTIPLALALNVAGIGTGWATQIPPHDPMDLIEGLRRRLADTGAPMGPLLPKWKGFKGTVEPSEDGKVFTIRGVYAVEGDTLHITELPVGTWTETYKNRVLEPLVEAKTIELSEELSDVEISFTLRFKDPGTLQAWAEDGSLASRLKLVDTVRVTNVHLFPPGKEHVQRYDSAVDVMEAWFPWRYGKYEERKAHLLLVKEFERDLLKFKVQFIQDKMSGRIQLEQRTYDEVLADLASLGYPEFGSSFDDPSKTYKYITNIGLFACTTDRRDQLEAEYRQKVVEYDNLATTTVEQLWNGDLNELAAVLQKTAAVVGRKRQVTGVRQQGRAPKKSKA